MCDYGAHQPVLLMAEVPKVIVRKDNNENDAECQESRYRRETHGDKASKVLLILLTLLSIIPQFTTHAQEW
jgi:hypothetical protein